MNLSDFPASVQGRIAAANGKRPPAPTVAKPAMNQWESRYAAYLDGLKRAGEIKWFEFECWRIRIGRGAYYTPDFVVLWADGGVTFEEVKGFWREAAKVRIKAAAERYGAFGFYVVRPDGQGWERKPI